MRGVCGCACVCGRGGAKGSGKEEGKGVAQASSQPVLSFTCVICDVYHHSLWVGWNGMGYDRGGGGDTYSLCVGTKVLKLAA